MKRGEISTHRDTGYASKARPAVIRQSGIVDMTVILGIDQPSYGNLIGFLESPQKMARQNGV